MNITIITGWISAILLVFNFATCLITPWAKKTFLSCEGKECEKGEPCKKESLCKYHKPFVILSILAVLVHIILSLIY